MVERGQVKSENSSLPIAVRVLKPRVLKLPSEFAVHTFIFSSTLETKYPDLLLNSPVLVFGSRIQKVKNIWTRVDGVSEGLNGEGEGRVPLTVDG